MQGFAKFFFIFVGDKQNGMMEFIANGSIEIKDCTVYLTDKKIEFQSF